jgi:hypothetical protein
MRKLLVVILIGVAVLVWFPGPREKIGSAINSAFSGIFKPGTGAMPGTNVFKVYVLRDGPYYHLATCPQIVGKTPVVMTLPEARELYKPCPVCNPPP